ncbi:MAG: Ig-like domain-containing protein [Gemmatimonadota bacterium]|nr:Ig-like domain-containing protein [Gemmatimonadota bacterium]
MATVVPVIVVVHDAGGAPVRGVQVFFAVTLGGGSVAPASTETDGAGSASGSWVLGTVVGQNELRATVSGLPPVVFTAMARAGPAAVVEKVSGDNQQGQTGTALEQLLSVRVKDSYNNPISAATVTFAVTSGGGTIQGSPATTNSDGLATAGQWTLGSASTDQTVSASSGSASAVFTAHREVCQATAVTIGVPVAGTLAAGDCGLPDALADLYALSTSTSQAVTISLTSAAFLPLLTVTAGSGAPVASDDQVGPSGVTYCVHNTTPPDGCHTPSTSTRGSPIMLLAAPGSRTITATSADKQGAGAYTLTVEASSSVSNCRTVFMERGATSTQQLEATDCLVKYGDAVFYYSDDIKIYLSAGSTLQVTMSSSAFTPWLDFFSPTGSYVATCVNPGTAACTFAAQSDGYYLLAPSSFEEQRAGAYTLTVK